mgnify:CR=1 FL=1
MRWPIILLGETLVWVIITRELCQRYKRRLIVKISKEFFVEEEDTTSRLNSGLGKMFGDLLLPPENFGKKPSGGTSGGQGGSGHTETHKKCCFWL